MAVGYLGDLVRRRQWRVRSAPDEVARPALIDRLVEALGPVDWDAVPPVIGVVGPPYDPYHVEGGEVRVYGSGGLYGFRWITTIGD